MLPPGGLVVSTAMPLRTYPAALSIIIAGCVRPGRIWHSCVHLSVSCMLTAFCRKYW